MNAETKPRVSVLIQLPEGERGWPAHQLQRVEKLLRRVADPTVSKHRKEAARDELRAMEEGRRLGEEHDALALRFAELEVLERARDPEAKEVVETAKSGRRRILTRDGLESLLQANAITPLQYVAGLRYRDLYEATERSIKSNLDRSISGSEDKRKLEDVGQKIQARNRLEAKVQAAGNGRLLNTLRRIAGEGRTISNISTAKSQDRKLNGDALRIALDVCADHWGLH
jgi:hypothetical protein